MDRLAGRRIGVVFGSLTPPEELARGAALAEELGFGDLWFSEDCFFSGGVSGLTQLLASTSTATAGLGLASVVTRHPAVLAMELAGLARMHPGRVRTAVGLGNNHQMGLLPARPLTAVTQTFEILRSLLAGGQVDRRTVTHEYNNLKLDYPPTRPPELWIGAVNQQALQTAGRLADGVLLSVLAGPPMSAGQPNRSPAEPPPEQARGGRAWWERPGQRVAGERATSSRRLRRMCWRLWMRTGRWLGRRFGGLWGSFFGLSRSGRWWGSRSTGLR
ncbi:luciferase-like monooxygenase [Kribbella sp. VKM Ac-2568]|nr:luciferase-like monooxygenase [Kribbella sp. VKM Ac-2568]